MGSFVFWLLLDLLKEMGGGMRVSYIEESVGEKTRDGICLNKRLKSQPMV